MLYCTFCHFSSIFGHLSENFWITSVTFFILITSASNLVGCCTTQMWKCTATFRFFCVWYRRYDSLHVKNDENSPKNQQIYFYTFQKICTILVQIFLQALGPGRHLLCRMNFSNVFVDFHPGFWTYPLLLFLLLCFFSFSSVWVHQWRHKAIANTPKYARWKNFSYNTFLLDVTLAVCELSQKSCSNVNISASAVQGFLRESKYQLSQWSRLIARCFFRYQISCAHKQQVEASKTFVQCSLLEKVSYPGMLTLLVCHTNNDSMRMSLVFKKIIVAILGQGYRRGKFLFF